VLGVRVPWRFYRSQAQRHLRFERCCRDCLPGVCTGRSSTGLVLCAHVSLDLKVTGLEVAVRVSRVDPTPSSDDASSESEEDSRRVHAGAAGLAHGQVPSGQTRSGAWLAQTRLVQLSALLSQPPSAGSQHSQS
jgi:hypothetical protein